MQRVSRILVHKTPSGIVGVKSVEFMRVSLVHILPRTDSTKKCSSTAETTLSRSWYPSHPRGRYIESMGSSGVALLLAKAKQMYGFFQKTNRGISEKFLLRCLVQSVLLRLGISRLFYTCSSSGINFSKSACPFWFLGNNFPLNFSLFPSLYSSFCFAFPCTFIHLLYSRFTLLC